MARATIGEHNGVPTFFVDGRPFDGVRIDEREEGELVGSSRGQPVGTVVKVVKGFYERIGAVFLEHLNPSRRDRIRPVYTIYYRP